MRTANQPAPHLSTLRTTAATALATALDGPRLPKVNIRSIVAPTLSRYPTEYQWQELEELLRQALSTMPRQTLPEALAEEPARTVLADWRHRHWLDESAALLP